MESKGKSCSEQGNPILKIVIMNHNEDLAVRIGVKECRWILNKEPLGFGHWLNVRKEADGIADRALMWFSLKVRHGLKFQMYDLLKV